MSTASPERRVLLALSAVAALVVVVPQWGVLTPDTKPEVFLAPWRTLLRTGSAWQDSPFLGAPNFNVGLVPVTAVTALFDAAGLPPWLVMRCWRLLLLLVAAAGARALYRDLVVGTPEDTAPGRVAAAVAFVANPYLLLGGATTPTLLPYALLPWLLLALRRGFAAPRSWGAPAAAALTFAAMSGINAGVVPILQLLAVPVLLLHARRGEGRAWRDLLVVCARAGGLAVLLSAYWLVPALSAIGVGSAIAGTTESASVIAAPSSYAEVLRGLGLWPLYGADASGPFLPGLTAYLGSPAVILASFALPCLAAAGAWASRSPVRVPAVGLVAVAAPVMVGLHAAGEVSPFGRFLGWAFSEVPGAVAFRTTNKAGGVLVLGLALLLGLGAAAAARRLAATTARPARPVVLVAASVVVVTATAPAWSGGQYATRVDVPGYWREAAAALDAGASRGPGAGQPTRVLFVPGVALARYRWGYQGPDELGNALLERPTAYRSAVPAGTPWAANLLAGTDLRLQDGDLPRGALSALGRYLGAGDVLVRNDLVWELADGARPSVVTAAADADPGLRLTGGFGAAGQGTTPPGAPGGPDGALEPLRTYRVVDGRGPVRQVPAAGAVLLDGDGEALPDLAADGLLDGDPALLLAGSLRGDALARALGPGIRVVLTDTNRRRGWNLIKLGNGTGPLLDAASVPATTRALFGPEDQTVAVPGGDATVTQSGGGILFGPVPYGDPVLALDRDPTTQWQTGNFAGGVGDALTLQVPGVRAVPSVTVQLPRGAGRRATRVRVTVSGGPATVTRDVDLASTAPVRLDLPGAAGTRVRVELLAVLGGGFGPVGLAEVAVPGWRVATVGRLPTGLVDRVTASPDLSTALRAASVDVLLRRRASSPGTALDDEEPRLARDLTLPDARRMTMTGTVRITGTTPDAVLERLLGRDAAVTAAASSRAPDAPATRATAAVDVTRAGRPDLRTAWVPADPVVGEWVEIRFPRRQLRSGDRLTVTQDASPGAAAVTRARVEVAGGAGYDVQLGPGAVAVPLPTGPADRIRLTALERVGEGTVRVQDLSLRAVRSAERPSSAVPPRAGPGCLTVAELDGAPLRVRPTGTGAELAAGLPVPFAACSGRPASFAPGVHRLRPVADWAVDRLQLRDVTPRPAPGARVEASVEVFSDTERRVRTVGTGTAYYVVAGTGLDQGWTATADGRDLGPAQLLDGYSAGWFVADGAAHIVTIRYAPAGRATAAAGFSLAAGAGCLLLVAAGPLREALRRRRRPG